MNTKMTIEEYTKKSNEMTVKINALQSILNRVSIRPIDIDVETGKPNVLSYETELMLEHNMIIQSAKSELYNICRDFDKLTETHYNIYLDSK
jgi:hypothetical protein